MFLIWIWSFLFFPTSHCLSADSVTLFAHCNKDTITVRLSFSTNFFGVVYAHNRDKCSTYGSGEKTLFLSLPLIQLNSTDCGLLKTESMGWTSNVRVQYHFELETVRDTLFLVRCSETDMQRSRVRQHTPITLQLSKDNAPVDVAIVGLRYVAAVKLPSAFMHRVGSCLAFSGMRITDMTPLLDDEGCPLGESMTAFQPSSPINVHNAELIMFRFNGTHEFHIQCTVIQCSDRCHPPPCASSNYVLEQFDSGTLNQPIANGGTVSKRLLVSDDAPFEDNSSRPCVLSQESPLVALSVLTAVLVVLISIGCISAVRYRPWHFHLDVRDSPPKQRGLTSLVESGSIQLTATAAVHRCPTGDSKRSTIAESNAINELISSPSSVCSDRQSISDLAIRLTPAIFDSDLIKAKRRQETPMCCQIGESIEQLPQPPPKPVVIDHSVDYRALLIESQTFPSYYWQPNGDEKPPPAITVDSDERDKHTYETPTNCMLSTLF